MSMNFNDPMSADTKSMLNEFFGDDINIVDSKTALFNSVVDLNQQFMKEIANTSNQVVSVELNDLGDVKTLEDGTKYQVTKQGWKKL